MSGPRVFHVDDNPDDLLLMRMAIDESGADIDYRSTSDSAGAIAALRREAVLGDGPALILLDINMPVNGWDILRGMRGDAGLARLPVAILSSSRRLDDEATGAALGVRACLVKPRTYGELLALVPRLLSLMR